MVIVEWRTKDKIHRGRLVNVTESDYVVATEGGTEEIPRRCCSIVDITEDSTNVKGVSTEKIDWGDWDWGNS
jgi:hypothetical protein